MMHGRSKSSGLRGGVGDHLLQGKAASANASRKFLFLSLPPPPPTTTTTITTHTTPTAVNPISCAKQYK